MARTEISVTQVTKDGVAQPAQVDADNANGMFVDLSTAQTPWLEVESTDGADQTVTFELNSDSNTVDGDLVVPDRVVTVPAGTTVCIGPFSGSLYAQAGNQLWVDPSVDTTLHFRAYGL